ncbi:Thioesterase/thiol ester dehydrase-isomerase [Cantharellus anzutake]|uniref:Thioesterase/thiol ester dehydrase-isomerase n=1 Tax=Cantharellus anzutake TaxID=1750568 RepID=UPI0019034531|nr:Thioesterase/thiol ester dehydrase-isomerase [Cantharellus anzutake]KAF8329375.1 Thioesterase/thiol ester dehydrase-isomerase [Cantharellus anzutake]
MPDVSTWFCIFRRFSSSISDEADATEYIIKNGYDKDSIWRQPICWGDQDSFRHVNNVHYVRFAESARIRFMECMATSAGGDARKVALLAGQGVGLILKSVTVDFKRPVVYPDTLILSQKPHTIEATQFSLTTVYYSLAQSTTVAKAESVLAWYDYNKLRKCEGPQDLVEYIRLKLPPDTGALP